MSSHCQFYDYKFREVIQLSFKIIHKNYCGLDVHNCLTLSNLKLDDIFSDIFGKSSRSITEQILQHPGEFFDVKPFVDRRCKTSIEEIQAAIDGAISPEQSVKLRQCPKHIDELEEHKAEIDRKILRLSDKYEAALNLIRTVRIRYESFHCLVPILNQFWYKCKCFNRIEETS